MKKKNGFTLIELLAVIIILGILMIIAIPSVTKYINDSRKSAYINTAKQIANAAKNIVNSGKFDMYDTDTTYFIPNSCIKVENGEKAKSPYGEFVNDKTYVVVTYDGQGYDYYWISLDETGTGIEVITSIDELDESLIKSDLKMTDVNTTLGVGGRKNIRIYSSDCSGYTDGISQVLFNVVSGNISSLKIGDEVCIDTECFNIIAVNGDNVTLLAKYNLYVGTIFNKNHNFISVISEEDPYYLKQIVPSVHSNSNYVYGATEFSKTNYWYEEGNTYPMDIYDTTKNSKPGYSTSNGYMTGSNNSSIVYFVLEYENVLKSKGASISNIRLPNRSELASISNRSFIVPGSFWLGTAYDDNLINTCYGGSSGFSSFRYTAYSTTGVRPVIEIKKSSIK